MKFKLLVASVALATAQVQAGGFENARLDTSFMYDEGGSITIGGVRKTPSVTGDTFATNKSAIGSNSSSSIAIQTKISDRLALGLVSYESGTINLNYQGAGWGSARDAGTAQLVDTYGSNVDLQSDSMALLGRYTLSDNFSILGGLRRDKVSVSRADIFKLAVFTNAYTSYITTNAVNPSAPTQAEMLQGQVAGATAVATVPTIVPSIQSGTDIVPVLGLAYERPEIALKLELLYQPSSTVKMASQCGMGAGNCTTDLTIGGLPDFLTLNFQTGIAADTLLFGAIHRGAWSKAQISVPDTEIGAQAGPTSSFKDSTEYSLGIGRKLSENWSVSASFNWEPKSSGTTNSLFTVNNGYKGVSLGAKYSIDDIELSAGYNHTKLGDILYDGTSDNLMSGNSVDAYGVRVKLKF